VSILGNIFNKIFHRGGDTSAGTTTASTSPAQAPASPPPPDGSAAVAAGLANQQAASAAQQASQAAQQPVDVEAVLNGMPNPQKLNWRTSIVDLMKLLDLDSSLNARKELATELGYSGAKDGSAEMNMWLHRQVMNKLAANGGKVPADLRD
jgi:hypothetical protein